MAARRVLAVTAAAAAAFALVLAAQDPARADGIRLDPVARGLDEPVHVAAPAGDARLFVTEKGGRIRVIRDGRLLERPYLDIARDVSTGGEQGLLSVAFHPRFRDNGRFYVNFTDRRGDTRVVGYRADPAADTADPASAALVLHVPQPYANHNGGHVLFGPDGMLYVGMGDGGAGGDPHGHAQDRRSLLGKLLRLDVDGGVPYAVPPGNPFAGGRTRAEIWALGLRNPWRIAFDSGLVYIADVGQNRWEEVNVAPADRGGLNYGWRTMEGAHCYRNPFCGREGLVLPAVAYDHDDGCSVIGGVVYRGRAAPVLAGRYLYSDWCGGWLRSFTWRNGAATDQRRWEIGNVGMVTSFGTDGSGEVYLVAANGIVYRITAAH